VGQGQEAAAYVSLVCEKDEGYVELRLYASDAFARPSFWIGIFDETRALRRTWISDGLDLTVRDIHRWLRPIVGYELAGRLARMALDVKERSAEAGGTTPVVHLSGLGAARAS
jgi:hypothetical protein